MRFGTYFIILLFISACDPPITKGPLTKAELIAPRKDEVCITGTITSQTESLVKFQWKESANTDRYEVHVTELESKFKFMVESEKSNLEIKLKRNTPYSWYVVSISDENTEKAQSAVWKFFNSGPGTTSYAPFPAEHISPGLAARISSVSGKTRLVWSASDVDGDIIGFDIFFSTDINPKLFKSDVKELYLDEVAISPGMTYYWKIVSRDSKGNSSVSMVSHFSVL